MKRAFLVYGPESSGNRLVTRYLVACGCYGDGGHDQRLNSGPPENDDQTDIVWFRSVPYAKAWPNLVQHIEAVQALNYEPVALVLVRDWYAMARSQVKTGHVNNIETAFKAIQRAYLMIFEAIDYCHIDYVMVSYESLFIRQEPYMTWLLSHLGLKLKQSIEMATDQNAKHYADT